MKDDKLTQTVNPNLPDILALCYDRLRQVAVPPITLAAYCQLVDLAIADRLRELGIPR
jgi:hypothetical protein